MTVTFEPGRHTLRDRCESSCLMARVPQQDAEQARQRGRNVVDGQLALRRGVVH